MTFVPCPVFANTQKLSRVNYAFAMMKMSCALNDMTTVCLLIIIIINGIYKAPFTGPKVAVHGGQTNDYVANMVVTCFIVHLMQPLLQTKHSHCFNISGEDSALYLPPALLPAFPQFWCCSTPTGQNGASPHSSKCLSTHQSKSITIINVFWVLMNSLSLLVEVNWNRLNVWIASYCRVLRHIVWFISNNCQAV